MLICKYWKTLFKRNFESLQIFSQIRGNIHMAGVNDTGGHIFHEIYIGHCVVDTGNQNNDNNISLVSPQTGDKEKI